MKKVTSENYLNYLTFHGRTMEGAWYVVKNWGGRPEYYTNEAIGDWVDASTKVLENSGVK